MTGTVPTSTEDRQRLAYQAALGNAAFVTGEAGNFIWALGEMLARIYDTDRPEDPLPESIVEGLAKGLRIVGSKLMEENVECNRVLLTDWAATQGAAAPQNAAMPNRGAAQGVVYGS